MLWRKRQKDIIEWINNGERSLLITGARQIGKTYLIEETLKQQKCDFVRFNLIEEPEIIEVLKVANSSSIKAFLERLTIASSHDFIKGKTIIFFDEIQEYKEIVTKIKFLTLEGSFKYILSGSLLGVELVDLKSAPVGYLDTIKMYPMDFEEFIRALNIKESTIEQLQDKFLQKEPVDDFIHAKMLEAFRTYLLVGGMPAAVSKYIEYSDYNKISKIHMNIIEQYKKDFTKYEKEKKLKLIKTYELIPSELQEKNKRYIFTDLDPNLKFDRYENSFNWLIDAGVALPIFNVTESRLPLETNKKSNLFKLFLSDVGLLTSLYGKATQMAIINNDNSLNCGAIYEDIVAQELLAHGFKGYFFNSNKQGEIDFVIDYENHILPIEVKSGKDYKRHSALNNIINNKNYGVKTAIVLCNNNISLENGIFYVPIYMLMFLQKDVEALKINKIDLTDL